jgi:hypothetical protein
MIASAFCGDGRRASVSGGPLAVCPSPSQAGYRGAPLSARLHTNSGSRSDSRTQGPRPLTLVRNSTAILPGRPLKCLIQPYAHNQFAYSDHAGLVVTRTMWLAALCLSGFGAMVAICAGTPTPPPIVEVSPDKTTIGTGSSQDISAGTLTPPPIVEASPDKTTIGIGSSQDTLTRADKLEIAYVRDPPAAEPVMPVATAPDETPPQPLSPPATPKIVSRHSHDPNAKKVAAVSPGRRAKGQESKKRMSNVPSYRSTSGPVRVLRALPVC